MQVLGLFFAMLALTTAQVPQHYRNPGFRNSHTPLVPAASKERPYLSIPIVLMPDGQIIPKAQASYQYVSNAPAQPQHRNPKSRGPIMVGETEETYQVVVPPPPSYIHDQKQAKSPKNGASGRTMVSSKEQRGFIQHPQQNLPTKYHHHNDRSPSLPQLQIQKSPSAQYHVPSNQQAGESYKQNVANFINLATHLGTEVLSHHRGGQRNHNANQPITNPQQEMHKVQETYVMQVPPSQDQNSGFTYAQTQVPQSSTPQSQQVSQNTNVMQHNMYNAPQILYQSTPASQSVQYVQPSNVRESNQAASLQAGIQNQPNLVQQNLGSTVYFSGNQNRPAQVPARVQSQHQAGNQNYQIIQQGAQNVQLIPVKNFEQTQIMYAPQPVIEISSQDTSTQGVHPDYGIAVQNGPTYVVDGHQITYANAAPVSPSTFQVQQNGHQNYQHIQQVPQSHAEQAKNQNIYASHHHIQDAGPSFPTTESHQQFISSTQHGKQQINSQQTVSQSSTISASNPNAHVNQNGQPTHRNPPQTYAGHNVQPYETSHYSYGNPQPTYSSTNQPSHAKYGNPTPKNSNYQEYQYEYSTQSHRDERKGGEQVSAPPSNGGQLIYASSSAKQINYNPSAQDSTQSQSNPDQSSAYVSYPSTYKQEPSQDDAASPEPTFAKQAQSSHSNDEQIRNPEENSEDEDVETSYKVVYIPLDILKNILSNSVENQRGEKSS